MLKVDSTNSRVGINNQSPATALDIVGTTTVRAATSQDGVRLEGRSGGTGNYYTTLVPTTLTGFRQLNLPDKDGLVATTADPGLIFIKSQDVGTAVSSVEVTSAFSSTYDHYKIIYAGGTASADGDLGIKLGSTTTGYYMTLAYLAWGGTTWGFVTTSNGSSFGNVGSSRTTANFLNVDIFNPFASDETSISGQYVGPKTNSVLGPIGGFLNNTTSYTSFTISPNTGTLTGGTIRVYGYRNS